MLTASATNLAIGESYILSFFNQDVSGDGLTPGCSSSLRTDCGSQKMMAAAMQMAEKKVWAQRS